MFQKMIYSHFSKKNESNIINIMDTEIPDIYTGILEPDKLIKSENILYEDIKEIINITYPKIELDNFTKRIIWAF